MGLTSQLTALNAQNGQFSAQATAPMAEGGYNNSNIPSMPTAPVLTDAELAGIAARHAKQQQEQASTYGNIINNNSNNKLTRPLAPNHNDEHRNAINQLVVDKIWRIVNVNKLHAFFQQNPAKLQEIVDLACRHDYQLLRTQWELPSIDVATDLAVLALYDIVILSDDSGSMQTFESSEGASRVAILKEVLSTIAFWSTLFDTDGIAIRFLNSAICGDQITSPAQVSQLVAGINVGGGTPVGRQMQSKILQPLFLAPLRNRELEKPLLVITLTDGVFDSESEAKQVINEARVAAGSSVYGEKAVSFSFAQLGTDAAATRFLNALDVDPQVGHLIDCTSSFEEEKKQCGPGFTAANWVVKLMIGAVDPSYDAADEEGAARTQDQGSRCTLM